MQRKIGIFALVSSALLGAIMGIWVRMMSVQMETFQQITARAVVGGILGIILYSATRKIKFSNLFRISRKDMFYILIRNSSLVIGIGLFTFAITNGNFSNVSMIYAVPMTAALGIIILKEKLTVFKFLALLIGFIGVGLISVKNFSDFSAIGIGEIAALISTVFYSISYVTRKFISKDINNEELAIVGSLLLGLFALIISFVIGNDIKNFLVPDWKMMIVIVVAGLTFLLIGVTINYGFEHIDAIVANNLLALDPVFGVVVGTLLYRETPTLVGLIGGLLVIASAILINYSLEKKKGIKEIKAIEPA